MVSGRTGVRGQVAPIAKRSGRKGQERVQILLHLTEVHIALARLRARKYAVNAYKTAWK